MKLRLKRPLALLLSMVLLLGTLPTTAFATESDGLCPHHPRHDDTCGYVEAAAGQSCLHQHDGTCGYTEGTPEVPCDKDCTDTDGDGVVDHAGDCAYQLAVSGTPCNHIHDATCGYVEAVEGHPCKYAESPCPECAAEAVADNQPPAGNGGLEPDTDGNPAPQANGEAKITSLNLLGFTEHGESTSRDVNLLDRTSDEDAVKWDIFNPYTLKIGVSLPAGVENNTLTLTLPNGMKFVNLNPDNLAQNDGIASVTYEKPEKIYGYQPENGPLTVVFDSGVTSTTVTVSIQPDVAFFPVEKRNEGLLIEDAIQVELESGDKTDEQTIPVDVRINEDANAGAPSYGTLRIGDISDATPDVAPGETYNLSGNVWTGWFTYNEKQNYRLRSELVVVLSVPNVLTLENLSDFWTVAKGAADSENTDNTLWTLTAKGLYNRTPSFTGQIGVKIPDNAEPGTTYAIKQHSISVTTYGQTTPWKIDGTENIKTIWTLTVKDPTKVEIGITKGDATKVYDYTQKLASSGQPFTDYNTSLAGCVITNNGVADIEQDLIYKATFDQSVQFVTAVGIPCGWDETDNTWLPTEITITTDKNKTYTISAAGEDYSAIREVASLAYPDYGFILRAADIPDFDSAESIVSVEVELPGLPKGYKSSGNPVYEYAGSNNAYAGVWGRVRESRGETKTGTNTFSIYLKDGTGEPTATQSSTTTVADPGQLSASIPTSKITVDNVISTSVSSGDAIHICQTIVPHNAYGSFHNTEVLWYDPVIYLLEPEDMTIEKEKFTLTTTSSDGSTTSQEVNYTKTQVTEVDDLPSGYQLYEYTLNDKVLLGWWSGDWENTSLTVDFDYSVDPTAKTLSYDVQDLIFYKSSLGFEVRNNPVTDKYNLNGGKAIGGVATNTFTVQAVSGFNIAASIQIEGEGDDKWYTYDPENPTDTTAVFKDGDTANVRVTVINNSGDATSNVEVYIPIPKKNGVAFGDAFLSDTIGFDMLVGGAAEAPEGWSVQYGQVESVSYTDNGVPDEIKLKEGTNWDNSYENANMIKLSLSEGGTLENGGQAKIILKFKATTDTSQTDSMNIFKSWWKYSAGGTAMVDTPQDGGWTYNFGTLLQNGVVSGTVYLDANGNGIKDDDESGISGVTVKAVDADGREYPEQTTDENGQYSFKSLPGNKSVTITVLNPGSTDPSQTKAYRFSKTVASTTEQIGSDVTANETGSQATVTLESLGTSGTATVNAGLITPCTVTFAGGEQGSVSPGTVKIFPGQTLGDVLNQAPSVTPDSGYTHTGWLQTEGTTTLTNEQLLEQTITGGTTFTAQYSTLYTVTVKGSHAATTGEGQYAAGDTVTINAGSHAGLTFKGWTVTPESVKLTNADSATTTFTMPAGNVTVTANWASNEKIQVTPADIIIYMGGKSYEGVVDGSGTIIANQNAGLPEPGFRVTLPDALKDKDITSLTFKEKDGDRTWTFKPYDGKEGTDVYKLVPADGQAATRVQFTKADGTVIPSDEFEVGREVNTSFQMGLYKGSGETEVGEIVVIENGVEYAVDSSATGKLTVRGTTGDVSITSVSENAPTDGKPGAVAAANTTYTINKGNVQVDNDANVSLLFDGIINNEGNDRTGQLEQRAAKALAEENIAPAANHHFVYELKYLDLVDANNGNAWVKASDDLTIYWPLPEGADTNTLKVLHFKDLHRDMVTDQIEDEIAKCDVEIIPSTVSGNHVTFEIGSGGFSPFALVWEEDTPASSFTIEATVSGSGSINPGGTINVAAGSNQTITFTPDSGYYVSNVVVDGQSVSWTGNSYTFTNVTANHTIIVTFAKSGGGSGTTYYIIDAEAGQGGEISPDGRVRVARGSDKTFIITPDEGYRIADVLVDGRSIGVVSRYTFENVRSDHTIEVIFEKYSSVADPDDTGVSEWLDTSDHCDFLHGYTDGTFGPNRNMTRGEVAQMFYNLLLEQDVPQTTVFTDVPADMWCADAVNTLASLGIVEGIGNGLYAPDRAITRAEFTVIAMRFAELDTSGENIFSDVDTGDWFYEQVVGSIKYGWIQGYADGTFRPDNTITRAEVTTITNRMLGRAADEAFVDRHSDELRQFPDVPESYWAYYNIVEATNAHDFSMENGAENWSGLN